MQMHTQQIMATPVPPRTLEQISACRLCPTRGVCTAQGLAEQNLVALTEKVETTAPMQRGQYLFRLNDPADHCYVVRSGVFKTSTITAAGDEHVTGFYYPGELLGYSGLEASTHEDSASALTSSTACRMQFRELGDLFEFGAGNSLLRLLAEQASKDKLLQINLRQSGAECRIAGFFLLLGARLRRLGFSEQSLPLPMSRTDLANHLGLTLECLSRILSRWKKAGVIATQRGHIVVQQQDTLQKLTSHLPA